MKNIYAGCFLAVLMATSCNTKTTAENPGQLALNFSDLECRAYTLREQRYALANKIRFTQDSIIQQNTPAAAKESLQENLNTMLKIKEVILAQSLQLADTIKMQLDTIIKAKLVSKEKIKEFEDALSATMKKKNCK